MFQYLIFFLGLSTALFHSLTVQRIQRMFSCVCVCAYVVRGMWCCEGVLSVASYYYAYIAYTYYIDWLIMGSYINMCATMYSPSFTAYANYIWNVFCLCVYIQSFGWILKTKDAPPFE